jgi:hypothetical protein
VWYRTQYRGLPPVSKLLARCRLQELARVWRELKALQHAYTDKSGAHRLDSALASLCIVCNMMDDLSDYLLETRSVCFAQMYGILTMDVFVVSQSAGSQLSDGDRVLGGWLQRGFSII